MTTHELLDAVNAAIASRLTGEAVSSVNVAGDSLQFAQMSLSELMAMLNQLMAEVNQSAAGQFVVTSYY